MARKLKNFTLLLFAFSLFSFSFQAPAHAIDIRLYEYHKAIQRMLNKNKKVHLAVIIDKVFTTFTGDWVPNWRETLQHTLVIDLQTSVLRYSGFTDYPQFSLVDRAGIEGVLKELNFQQTGYLSRQDQLKIGELLGVTHILFETYSRYPDSSPYTYQDQADFRLVEVKTARVLATDTVVNRKYADRDEWTGWAFKNP